MRRPVKDSIWIGVGAWTGKTVSKRVVAERQSDLVATRQTYLVEQGSPTTSFTACIYGTDASAEALMSKSDDELEELQVFSPTGNLTENADRPKSWKRVQTGGDV